ncbi:hypothetical protein LJR034_007963 [Caballeronia sp. LjRoot34]|uniref:hypothetical protein n=1 Tax=Caballeronia sp. LjRoot34 TaxID=3342325 RepID=UPI003ECF33D7
MEEAVGSLRPAPAGEDALRRNGVGKTFFVTMTHTWMSSKKRTKIVFEFYLVIYHTTTPWWSDLSVGGQG